MTKHKICKFDELLSRKKIPVTIKKLNILLIYLDERLYAIENKCGHFGIRLDDAHIENKSIKCSQHGIIFSLETGENINRSWEDCDTIIRYNTFLVKDDVFIEC